ncbi:MAG: adenosylcobinamide-phosphate synthase CbiB [Terracidiphilus sp.]|jgi:adenosylcobinamide-phosphate synthase
MEQGKFAVAYALDWCVGDPEWLPHPVRLIGWSIDASERALRRRRSGKRFDLAAGALIAVGVPALSALCVYALLKHLRGNDPAIATAAEVWLASTCLSTRNLLDEAAAVMRALENGNLQRARLRVARIVGRDTEELGEEEICRALVEALAESLSDGVIAPLFYLAVGGVPLAMAYKAINTLDSMIGHKDEKYLYFGRVAARVDDVANFIPARIAALLLCVAAEFIPQASGVRAGHIWLRDGSKHASPNAGQVEAAIAGLLGVRLGGTNKYAGELIASPHLGGEFAPPSRKDARRAWKAVGLASLLGFGGAFLLAFRKKHA